MGLLDELTGNGQRRQDYQNYTDRYDQGRPHEGYDDDEVARRYSEVSGEVDEDTYRHSARQAFERMSPDERREFGRQLQEQAQGRAYDTGYRGEEGDQGAYEDPNRLADITTRVHQQAPGLLGELLGSAGGGGALGGLLGGSSGSGGGALGGLLGGDSGSGASNPVAKAALAGIAAFAAKQLMNRR